MTPTQRFIVIAAVALLLLTLAVRPLTSIWWDSTPAGQVERACRDAHMGIIVITDGAHASCSR